MKPNTFLQPSNIDRIVSCDFEEVATVMIRSRATDQECLLKLLSERFADKKWTRNQTKRIALVRTLVGLLPESLILLKQLLGSTTVYLDFEIHFTLFCSLGWTCEIAELSSVTKEILSVTRSYMISAKSPQAHAVWMAGDLLGDHWEPNSGLQTLIEVLKGARSPVGRLAALNGIERSLLRQTEAQFLIPSLEDCARNDRSRRVREEITACVAKLNSRPTD